MFLDKLVRVALGQLKYSYINDNIVYYPIYTVNDEKSRFSNRSL